MDIDIAVESDVQRILALQDANQPERGGTLSACFSRAKIVAMMHDMPLLVARQHGQVVGFLMTSSKKMNTDILIIQAMLTAYPGSEEAYVYGPVCVAAEARGKGVAQALFAELKRMMPGREGILFIRRDNPASLKTHAKMGMNERATFTFNGREHVVLSYWG
jgi:predicted GNAT superfamily acetyltransferase